MKKFISIGIVLAVLLSDSLVTSASDNTDTYINKEYIQFIEEICEDYNVSPELIEAMIETESAGKPNVTSKHGAVGLMQIIPRYHVERMKRLGVTDLYEPYSNILVGVDFVHELFQEYGEVYDVLMFYNEGYPGVEKSRQLNFNDYSQRILKRSEELTVIHYGI